MSKNTVVKTIRYLRALSDSKPINLQKSLKKARVKYHNVSASEKKFAVGYAVRIQHYKDASSGILIHLSRYSAGEQAATLKKKEHAKQEDEKTQKPPEDREFKNGDSFLLINKSDVIFCSAGITIQQTTRYLSMILKTTKSVFPLTLSPASNIDRLQLIQQQGIKEIEIRSNAYRLSTQNINMSKKESFFSGARKKLKAFIESDDSISEQQAMEDLVVGVSIKLDGASRASLGSKKVIDSAAEELAQNIDSDFDSYTLTTLKGETITSEQIQHNNKIRVNKEANSVSYIGVFNALEEYFCTLKDEGYLEQ